MGFRLPELTPKPITITDKYENKLVDTCELTRLDSGQGSDYIDCINEFLEEMGDSGWQIKSIDQSPIKGHSRIWLSRKKPD